MTVSRIGKLFCEIAAIESLEGADESRSTPLQIIIGDDDTRNSATMAHFAVMLALRVMKGPIRIFAGNTEPLAIFSGVTSLSDELLELEKCYSGKLGQLEICTGPPADIKNTLCIGKTNGPGYLADAAGWVAGINTKAPQSIPAEAPAAAFAVATAFSQFFNQCLLGKKQPKSSWTLNVLTLEIDAPFPESHKRPSIDLGHGALIGAGAIGTSAAAVLIYSGWTLRLDIADKDPYEPGNEETSLVISIKDARDGRGKAKRIAELVTENSKIKANGEQLMIDRYSRFLERKRHFILCAVDNSETRRELDNANVDVIINAAVGGTTLDAGHVLLSQHVRGCVPLSDLYARNKTVPQPDRDISKKFPKEIQDQCSRVMYEDVSMAAPFLALASASLMVAACAASSLKRDMHIRYFKLDLFGRVQNSANIKSTRTGARTNQNTD